MDAIWFCRRISKPSAWLSWHTGSATIWRPRKNRAAPWRKACSRACRSLSSKKGAKVRIRPTRNCAGLALVLLAMWYAGASQGNGAAYLLLFVTISLVLISALHAWLNVTGLRLEVEAPQPVFVGQEVVAPVEVLNDSRRERLALRVSPTAIPKVA